MDEEFSECESLVNGVSAGSIAGAGYHGHNNGHNGGHGHTLPAHAHTYARPPPVALEFSDSMSRRGHRPAPMYRSDLLRRWGFLVYLKPYSLILFPYRCPNSEKKTMPLIKGKHSLGECPNNSHERGLG